MNYFAHATAAQRYASGRPFFHPQAVERIRSIVTDGTTRPARALDVGCGTGQSTRALVDVADQVVGVDVSLEMLACAASHPRVRYVEARAERMPFDAGAFDLVTVALAFHWFDRARFMGEAARLLSPDGWLVIYNDFFAGRMVGNDAYARWNDGQYLTRYPTPPRRSDPMGDNEAAAHGFAAVAHERFVHDVEFTPAQLVTYLSTQSNVIAAVEQGRQGIDDACAWLTSSVTPIFEVPSARFPFECEIHIYRRSRT